MNTCRFSLEQKENLFKTFAFPRNAISLSMPHSIQKKNVLNGYSESDGKKPKLGIPSRIAQSITSTAVKHSQAHLLAENKKKGKIRTSSWRYFILGWQEQPEFCLYSGLSGLNWSVCGACTAVTPSVSVTALHKIIPSYHVQMSFSL